MQPRLKNLKKYIKFTVYFVASKLKVNVHVHQGFPMVCSSTNIVYSTSGNWVLQLLATLTKLLLQVTRVERSWEKSAKICKKTSSFETGILFGNSQKMTLHENTIFQKFVHTSRSVPMLSAAFLWLLHLNPSFSCCLWLHCCFLKQ